MKRFYTIALPATLYMAAIFVFLSARPDSDIEGSPIISDTARFEKVFVLGLQGNVSGALTFLDTIDNSTLTTRQLKIKKQYYSRFRTKDEKFDFKASDTAVINILKIYHAYWRNVLLNNSSLSASDSMLSFSVIDFLKANFGKIKGKTTDDLYQNFPQYLREYLVEKGIFAATGKTGMFFDLLLHTRETGVSYDVKTPEEEIKVKVIFMEDLISNGWEEYATFGKYFPGGWATKEALYCVKETYDLESENFKISYLMHEGKHFADYKLFPSLSGADLEYRAKLVEMSSARESLYRLIKFFMDNSAYERSNPHAFANYCVIRNLSQRIFGKENVKDINIWKSKPTEEINKHAEWLLKQNTEDLKKTGAATVSEFIK